MSSTIISVVKSYSDYITLKMAVHKLITKQPQILDAISGFSDSSLVVIKPNWVQQSHEYKPEEWESVITHPDVVLAVVEVLAELMHGRGSICLCDAPHTYANFEQIVNRGQLKKRFEALKSQWPNLNLELLDLRREIWTLKEGVVINRKPNVQDPRGYVRLNMKANSLFYKYSGEGLYYGADYDSRVVNSHHYGETQEYLLAGTPMACDLFVNLPKMKTHKKTGITCCLKNLVGINGDKNWLPHHTKGSPQSGGDEFQSDSFTHIIERKLKKIGQLISLSIPVLGNRCFRKMRNVGKHIFGDSENVIRNGNWHGNDTCWRMVLDLNRAFLYGNSNGSWRSQTKPKHYLAIVDGIIAGQGNGPLCPDSVSSGILIGGTNPAVVDAVVSRLMGFDIQKIPMIKNAFEPHLWPIACCQLDEIFVDDERYGKKVALADLALAVQEGFKPHFGWRILQDKEY